MSTSTHMNYGRDLGDNDRAVSVLFVQHPREEDESRVLDEQHPSRPVIIPAGIHECGSNCSICVLVCVWSQMRCCKWFKLSLEANFAVRHTKPRYTKLWRHNDLIYARYDHWRFCPQI